MLEAPIRPEIRQLGPEPLDPQFTLARFKQLFAGRKGRIKQMLMNPKFIAGARPSCQLSQEQLSSATRTGASSAGSCAKASYA
jgi:formamidopyrimidine-DNA glycosylase